MLFYFQLLLIHLFPSPPLLCISLIPNSLSLLFSFPFHSLSLSRLFLPSFLPPFVSSTLLSSNSPSSLLPSEHLDIMERKDKCANSSSIPSRGPGTELHLEGTCETVQRRICASLSLRWRWRGIPWASAPWLTLTKLRFWIHINLDQGFLAWGPWMDNTLCIWYVYNTTVLIHKEYHTHCKILSMWIFLGKEGQSFHQFFLMRTWP